MLVSAAAGAACRLPASCYPDACAWGSCTPRADWVVNDQVEFGSQPIGEDVEVAEVVRVPHGTHSKVASEGHHLKVDRDVPALGHPDRDGGGDRRSAEGDTFRGATHVAHQGVEPVLVVHVPVVAAERGQ